jgi:hypothetical protein
MDNNSCALSFMESQDEIAWDSGANLHGMGGTAEYQSATLLGPQGVMRTKSASIHALSIRKGEGEGPYIFVGGADFHGGIELVFHMVHSHKQG